MKHDELARPERTEMLALARAAALDCVDAVSERWLTMSEEDMGQLASSASVRVVAHISTREARFHPDAVLLAMGLYLLLLMRKEEELQRACARFED